MQIVEKEILIVVVSLVHCCATCHLLFIVVKNVIIASMLYDVADVQFTVE